MLVLIRQELLPLYYESHKEAIATISTLEKQLQEAEKKITRLEERFIMEEIDREMFLRYKEKFKQERDEIAKNLGGGENKVSNLEKAIEDAIIFALKLAPTWDLGDYGEKQLIQKIVFPEGIFYNRKTDRVRIQRINSVFAHIASLAWVSENEKPATQLVKVLLPVGWEHTGFEPRTLCL